MIDSIQQARDIIDHADAILITAGAGMGVDSGLPDFRGSEGFWKAYPKARELGLDFSELANPKWFEQDPGLAWAFYGHRLHLYRDTQPHHGFYILKKLVHAKNDNYFIFTSNVDGQFQKAEFCEKKILEVHGSIHHLQCLDDCSSDIWESKGENITINTLQFQAENFPLCKHCGKIARPNILMFGDWGWNASRTSQQEQRFAQWLKSQAAKDAKIAIIEMGAGEAVPTVRLQGEQIARAYEHAKLIRVNPRDDQLDTTLGVSISMGALEALERIVNG